MRAEATREFGLIRCQETERVNTRTLKPEGCGILTKKKTKPTAEIPTPNLCAARLGGQFLVRGQKLAQTDESADHSDAGLNGECVVILGRMTLQAGENTGDHDCAVLGEGKWPSRRILELAEVVTTCDHLRLLPPGELKHEVRRKAAAIALDGLTQGFRRGSVCLRKIRIQHDAMGTDRPNAQRNALAVHDGGGSGRAKSRREAEAKTKRDFSLRRPTRSQERT
jgi:hypothetical protein